MIIIGLGGNLPSARFGSPQATLNAALAALEEQGLRVTARSRWYESAPVPLTDQPWFVNGVAAVETDLSPKALLALLLATEQHFGRVRSVPNAARIIDLDLLLYHDEVINDAEGLIIPHPRLHERAFVLLPLRDIAPDWRHPVLGLPLDDFIRRLPADQMIRPMADPDT